jgi:hypothetical protein
VLACLKYAAAPCSRVCTYDGHLVCQDYIVLYQGNWPATLNRVYDGGNNPYVFFAITDSPSTAVTCANASTYIGKYFDQAYHSDTAATYYAKLTTVQGRDGNTTACTAWSTVELSSEVRPSGAPFISLDAPNTFSGFGTASESIGGTLYVTFSPLYEGYAVLWHWWQGIGGASLCYDADC